ncbi:class I SAM-dependent methyltransferase [Chloroflexota bacterium]
MLFDEWPERYDQWFKTPIGKLVKEIEGELIYKLLNPAPGEKILDAGCGTGIFTIDYLTAGAMVTGFDISRPMLSLAGKKTSSYPFSGIQGDMLRLPFNDNSFDKAVSVTALEFIADAQSAVDELFRVTRPGGPVVVATLNNLSSWAVRRKAKTPKGQKHVLENAFFRSPNELLSFSTLKGTARTAIHFQKNDTPDHAMQIEESGRAQRLATGAFVAVRWEKSCSDSQY